MPQPFDLSDAFTIVDVQAAGGFLQSDDEITMQVFVEITSVPLGENGPETKTRFVMDLDQYFAFAARIEHAAKTTLVLSM